jgi:hypothetical protein
MNAFTDTPPLRRPMRARRERCIAMVDARYLAWLADQDDGASPRLDRLRFFLEAALEALGAPTEVARIYWYASQRPERALPGLVHRWVAPEPADAGASLTLALSRDLLGLAEHPGYDRVLLLTDDDRLLPVVDAVQLQGLTVCLLADESAADLDALATSDADWSALLRQADERCIVRGQDLARAAWGDGTVMIEGAGLLRAREGRDGGPRHAGADHRAGALRPPGPSPEELQAMRQTLQPMVHTWWDDLPVEDRQELEAELPNSRGLPQEADRHLLLRLSQQLGRPLTTSEKKLMREMARDAALGGVGTAAAPTVSTSDPAAPADPSVERAEA